MKPHKFNAKRTVVDGIAFASRAEAKRYGQLLMLQRAGEIHELELQPGFELMAVDQAGRRKRIGKYVADFAYVNARTGERVVEDVKGVKTAVYRLKKRMVEAQYGIAIVEIAA